MTIYQLHKTNYDGDDDDNEGVNEDNNEDDNDNEDVNEIVILPGVNFLSWGPGGWNWSARCIRYQGFQCSLLWWI